MRRIAVIGSGISGLAAAYKLAGHARVTLFEAGEYFGGHTHTVDMTLDGVTHGVDTGFLVFNHRTYPQLVKLFDELKVHTTASDMSFSVKQPSSGLEWSGSNLNGVFAQRRNLLRPSFLRMLADILRFNKLATGIAAAGSEASLSEDIGSFLDRHGFGRAFREGYFLPMIGCIWSCPTDQMLRFPVATMIRFCHNHGLLQVADRPQWYTVTGGARNYVQKILPHVPDARLRTPVRRVLSTASGVEVSTDAGTELFDDAVLACHSDQSLALLARPTPAQRAVLGAIRYQPNRAVLHTDTSLLPKRRHAWASWNYERAAAAEQERAVVCLHYLINRLQPLPWQTPVVVSLNPGTEPDPRRVVGSWSYSHPVFDLAAIQAQRELPAAQGEGGIWLAGAWTRYGFHEDGLMSAQQVVERLLSQPPVVMAPQRRAA